MTKKIPEKAVKLLRDNTLVNDFVIIDGQGRSGKSMISVILSTMHRVEKMRLDMVFDLVPRFYFLGKMSHDAAVVALKIEADEKLYNTTISRSVNFRFDDYTGIWKTGKPFLYIKRLFQKPEQSAVRRIRKEKPIFQNMAHDGLHMIRLYFDAFGEKLKFVHVFRDPVGNIYEQGRRDIGARIGKDPREFQLTYKWRGKAVSLMAEGLEDDYLSANPTERILLTVDQLFRKNIKGYLNLDDKWKKKVFFIEFEKFIVNPMPYLRLLEKFLGTKMTRNTRRIMKRERCPRKLDPQEREKRIMDIEKKVSPKYKKIFRKLLEDYDKREWEKLGYNSEQFKQF